MSSSAGSCSRGSSNLDPQELLLYLQSKTSPALSLRINHNRKTMVSLRRLGQASLRLSLHERFLTAPPEVVDAVIALIRSEESRASRALLRKFIHEEVEVGPVRRGPLTTQGVVYDLQAVYDQVNRDYFGGELQLTIGWFGRRRRRIRGGRVGEYCYGADLVRIHRQLDNRRVPWQYLHFVVYHEMLHHLVRPYVGPTGRIYPHTREFRERERQFAHYDWVKQWERGEVGN